MVTADTTIRSPWRIFGLVAGSVALATLNFSMIFVAFGEISDSFDASDSTISWALTGFAITTAAVMVPGGWLADRFGRTRIFLIGFALFLAGSAGVAVAPTVEFLIAARVLQAAGLAIEAPASFALVLNAFPARMRSTAVGAMGAAGGVAAALGPLVGGALVEALGWRWAFFCNVPVGIVVLALVGPRLPPNRVHLARKTPDLIGVLLLMFGVGSLALGIVQSDDWGFGDVRTVAALMAALILLAGLVMRSRVHQEPILYVPLFANHDFRVGSALSFFLAGNFMGSFLAFVTFLHEGWGLSLFKAGLAVGLIPAIGGPMSVVSGRLADRFGHRTVILPGALLMAAGGLWMWSAAGSQPQIWSLWVPVVVVYGIGVGLGHAACQSAALSAVNEDRLGIGGAMNRIFMEIGGTISIAVVIALFVRYDDPVDGLRASMLLLVIVSAISVPIAASLRNRGHALAA